MNGLDVDVSVAARGLDAAFTAGRGTVTAILGPNGAGKSTLLSVIAGLHKPDHGHVLLGDRVLTDIARRVHLPAHRRGVALLAQQALLFPHLSVADNVAFAPRSQGRSRAQSAAAATEWLTAVDAAEFADRKPAQLSGGQAQRVAVARALAAEPRLLLLDEPMAALDVAAAPALRSLLRRVLRSQNRTALLVTHDMLDALALADRVIVLDAGKIVEQGGVRETLTRPRSSFTARIAGINLCSGTVLGHNHIRTDAGIVVQGESDGSLQNGDVAVAVFSPSAVSVYAEVPQGSPRNHFRVTIAEIENRGDLVRLRGEENGPDSGLMADITPGAAADLDLVPGVITHFVVKAAETKIYPA